MRWLLLILMPAVLLVACSDDSGELVARDIVSEIPWEAPESAQYRLLQGDDIVGTGELRLQEADGDLLVRQTFEFPELQVKDTVSVEVDPQTLRPRTVKRAIDGPEGKRECQATYEAGDVTIEQTAKDDKRTDKLNVPPQHYDSWSDLFLWRTIEFFEGQELEYVDVGTCPLAKPDLGAALLRVKGVEQVAVPAGTFEAWRLEFKAEGGTQKAWYADDARRTLVRYDNGDLVFELESID